MYDCTALIQRRHEAVCLRCSYRARRPVSFEVTSLCVGFLWIERPSGSASRAALFHLSHLSFLSLSDVSAALPLFPAALLFGREGMRRRGLHLL